MSFARSASRCLRTIIKRSLNDPTAAFVAAGLAPSPLAAACEAGARYSPSQFVSLRGFASQPRKGQWWVSQDKRKRLNDQAMYFVAAAVGMVGLTYASVPLYRMFCQATGYGGTVQEGRSVEEKLRRREEERDEALEAAAAACELTVHFNADVADGLPWKFLPTQRSVKIHPGQSTLAFYTAHNHSDHAITGVSTYNVTPQQVGQYFNKVQCFCFEEQRLRGGERVDMPVFFYIDPEFATDPKMKGIGNITLSYTFFKVSEDEGDEEEVAAVTPPQAAAIAAGNKRQALTA